MQAQPGVSPKLLAQRINRVMPPRLIVETGTQAAARQSQDIKDQLSFFRVILLVFGGVALLVGSFLIFNTFSITVAQRIRELGMLRTLGATPRPDPARDDPRGRGDRHARGGARRVRRASASPRP